ncbi:DUF485 domain-containing protein [Fictibacillus iocasae]|uniref:DUF485 domain-containing protein n=1 Tax=Fictibacillus iocasae TaxID=2715437 RepID=A0ABW2NLJ7_9BACL
MQSSKTNELAKEYTSIATSPAFKDLMRKKRNFILPSTIFFFLFYFALPIMTAYTTILNEKAIGDITWAWLFAFSQFVMTWSLCVIYSKRAAKFDEMTSKISSQTQKEAS